MRKFLALLLVLVILLPCVSGCTNIPEEAPLSFAEFLDEENFVHGLTQKKFKKQMKAYSYKGKPITEILIGCNEDGLSGGGYKANGDLFGFENMYCVNEHKGHKDYYNSFYTEVALDGLAMPYGIDFIETIEEALVKMGVAPDVYEDFLFNEKSENFVTLSEGQKSAVTLYRVQITDCAPEYDYAIEYNETYNITNKAKEEVEITRTVRLWFTGGQERLEQIYVKVNERRETKQDTSQN